MSGHAPETLDSALAWANNAACRGQNLALFFTESKTGVEQAKRICARCPVREDCLDEVLRAENDARYGVYGGLTGKERTQLARRR